VCSFAFPDFVPTSLLKEEGKEADALSEEKRGGNYTTPVNPIEEGRTIMNPKINFKRILRIHDMSYKVKEWFKTAELIVTVK
jgi:hypothetical protein